MSTHFHTLTVKDIQKETAECVSIAFEVPAVLKNEFRFTQGQNITLKKNIGGTEIRRSYSICSSTMENELRIAVKQIDNGVFSVYANTQLKKGDTLEVLPPTGRFFTELSSTHQKKYIAFAAGSGITPILSIIKTTLAVEPKSSFTLIFGNRNRSSIIFKEALEAIKDKHMERFTLHHILSGEDMDTALNYGRIDANKCKQLFSTVLQPNTFDEYFICGPTEMIFTVKDFLLAQNISATKIHFELFSTPDQTQTKPIDTPKKTSSKNTSSQVTVKQDGTAISFALPYNSSSILDAALKQGVDLPYACKGGVCSTCRAKLLEGEVEMDQNYALEPDEVAAGFILTCQSHPRSEKVVVDFDVT